VSADVSLHPFLGATSIGTTGWIYGTSVTGMAGNDFHRRSSWRGVQNIGGVDMDTPLFASINECICIDHFNAVFRFQMPRHISRKNTSLACQTKEDTKEPMNCDTVSTKGLACGQITTSAIQSNSTLNIH
jgi:hypothetical protein